VQQEGSEVLNADAGNGFVNAGVQSGPFDCELERLAPVELEFG